MTARRSIGLPPLAVLGLAALGVPRAVAHDLALVGPLVNGLLVFAPLAVWVGYVLWRRVPNPFLALLAVGVAYGVLLAATHQILWAEAFAGDRPRLGGALAGSLAPAAEGLVLRVFSVGSSLVTGAMTGAGAGAVSWVLARAVPGLGPQ
ncbi:hypothetical protein [Actinokineospora sp. NPDC004072]